MPKPKGATGQLLAGDSDNRAQGESQWSCSEEGGLQGRGRSGVGPWRVSRGKQDRPSGQQEWNKSRPKKKKLTNWQSWLEQNMHPRRLVWSRKEGQVPEWEPQKDGVESPCTRPPGRGGVPLRLFISSSTPSFQPRQLAAGKLCSGPVSRFYDLPVQSSSRARI